MEAERQDAHRLAEEEQRSRRARGAQSLQQLQAQMADRAAVHAQKQVQLLSIWPHHSVRGIAWRVLCLLSSSVGCDDVRCLQHSEWCILQEQVDREKAMIAAVVARIEAEERAAAEQKRQRQAQLSESIREQQRMHRESQQKAQQDEALEAKRYVPAL